MSYILDKFNAGEVHIEDNVYGWLFDSGEFRPLMRDAMEELMSAGFASAEAVIATEIAYNAHMEETLTAYAESQERFWNDPEFEEARNEQMAEMRAAFGEGEEVVNVFTGRKHTL